MTEQFANNASTTLNGAINNSTTTVVVTNGSVFSQSGTFRVIVDSEIMLVSAISGNTLTVARGQEGTSAASHLTAAIITQIVTSGALAQFKLDTSIGVMRAGSGDPSQLPSFVQGKSASGKVVTTNSSVTAGNLLVVHTSCENSGSVGSTPTDNLLTPYTLISSIPTGASQCIGAVYAGIAPTSGICTVTGTQGNSFPRTSVGEYKNAINTVDSSNQATSSSSLSVTISNANSLVLGIMAGFSSSATFTAGTNFTANFTANGSDSTFYESALTSTLGSFTVSCTISAGLTGSIFFGIVFRPATIVPTVGQDGDFYIDTTNKKLYGPRTSGTYPLIGTLT